MSRAPRPLGWSVAAVIVACASLVACSGSTHDDYSASVVVAAMRSAATARITTTMSLVVKGQHPTVSTSSGVVDFRDGRAVATTRASTGSGAQSSPSVVETARWIGSRIYTSRPAGFFNFAAQPATAPDSPPVWTVVDYSRYPTTCRTVNELGGGIEAGFGAVDPIDIEAFTDPRGPRRVGTETISGVVTTHWRSRQTGKVVHCPGAAPSPKRPAPEVTFDLWIDAAHRVRRLETSTEQGDAASASTTDLSDFGVRVAVIAPTLDVIDTTHAMLATLSGSGHLAANAWQESAHGVLDAKPWSVFAARTTTGWHCYDVTGTPNPSPVGIDAAGPNVVHHDGRAVQCVPPAPLELGAELLLGAADADRYALVAVTPEGEPSARLVFAGGRSVALRIDRTTDLVSWSGPARNRPERVDFGSQSCSLVAGASDDCVMAG